MKAYTSVKSSRKSCSLSSDEPSPPKALRDRAVMRDASEPPLGWFRLRSCESLLIWSDHHSAVYVHTPTHIVENAWNSVLTGDGGGVCVLKRGGAMPVLWQAYHLQSA